MLLHNSILYIETKDFIEAGKDRRGVDKAVSVGNKTIAACKIPHLGNGNYFEWEKMSGVWREAILKRYPNPYDIVARQPILNMVKPDAKAEAFYNLYRYDGDKMLPIDAVRKYTRAAAWLTMLQKTVDDRKLIKKVLNLSVPEFYKHVGELLALEISNGKNKAYSGEFQLDGKFPTTYQNLLRKASNYTKEGYAYLISDLYGNKLSAKIGKTENGYCAKTAKAQEATIKKLARLHMNLDATQITERVNELFTKNNLPSVSSQTVANLIKKYLPVITPGRKGAKVYNNEVSMQVKRLKHTDYPLYYWTLDGWTVELLYQDGNNYSNRLTMVVVLDMYNKYPVGYAIGDRENSGLIRQALRNAIAHMNTLLGATYRPWQLQSDRYALKRNTPFYSSVSHLHTPAAVGNAKSKPIEPWFKMFNKKHCQTQFNWSGHNITASKENQPNTEFLDMIKTSFPTKEACISQVMQLMEIERKSLVNDFKAGFASMKEEDKVILSVEDLLMVFGNEHKELNSIYGQGLLATINGEKYTYESFDAGFRELRYTTKFNLMYLEENMNEVLAITEDGKQRFLLHRKMEMAIDAKSTTPEMLAYHQQIRDFNKARKEEIIQDVIEDNELVLEFIQNTPGQLCKENELALKTMLTYNGQQKERLQDAKGLGKQQRQYQKQKAEDVSNQQQIWEAQQQALMNERSNVNQYI